MSFQMEIFRLIIDKYSPDEIKKYLDAHPQAAAGKDDDGLFPLHHAAWYDNPEVVRIILDAHPEAAAGKDNSGWFPLHCAASNSNPKVVRIILDAHPQAAAGKGKDGRFPLHIAASNENLEVVKIILDAHPEAIVAKNFLGEKTPLDLAKIQDYLNVIEVLESALDKFMDRVPKEFICPITCDIMNDPVVAEDGNTYERADIVQWFKDHDTSPLTNVVLESKKVIPNRALKSLLDSYMGN